MANRKDETPEEEIEAWARRMIDEVEDFEYIGTAAKWREFVDDKMGAPQDEYQREKQLDAIADGRLAAADFYTTLGIHLTDIHYKSGRVDYRYQDTTGDYQGRGTFVSRAQIAGRIVDQREALEPPRPEIPF